MLLLLVLLFAPPTPLLSQAAEPVPGEVVMDEQTAAAPPEIVSGTAGGTAEAIQPASPVSEPTLSVAMPQPKMRNFLFQDIVPG